MNFKIEKYIILIISLIFFLIYSHILFGYFQLGDDTYIYLQYAKNILHSGEISFNLGQPTYGFTSPLWLGLIVLLSLPTGITIQIPSVLSLSFAVLTIITWMLILKKHNYQWIVLFLTSLIIITDPNLLKHSYLGMEATLSYFLSSIFIFFVISEKTKSKYKILGTILGLFLLLRPESALIAIVYFFYLLINRIPLRNLFQLIVFSVLIVMPWHIFAYGYFGQFLPNTFYAKGAAYPLGNQFLDNIFDSIIIFGGSYTLILLSITIFYALIQRRFYQLNVSVLFVSIILILILFYGITINNEFVYSRYYCIAFPFLLYVFFDLFNKVKLAKNYYKIIILATIILSQLTLTILYRSQAKDLFQTHEQIENEIIEWVMSNTAKNDKVVRARIGKIGFYTSREIIDPVGLINPEITQYYLKGNIYEYYRNTKPDYFITHKLNKELRDQSTLMKRFIYSSNFLVRQTVFGEQDNVLDTLNIYRIRWE